MKQFQPLQDSICLLAGTTPTRLARPGEQFDQPEACEAKAVKPKMSGHIRHLSLKLGGFTLAVRKSFHN